MSGDQQKNRKGSMQKAKDTASKFVGGGKKLATSLTEQMDAMAKEAQNLSESMQKLSTTMQGLAKQASDTASSAYGAVKAKTGTTTTTNESLAPSQFATESDAKRDYSEKELDVFVGMYLKNAETSINQAITSYPKIVNSLNHEYPDLNLPAQVSEDFLHTLQVAERDTLKYILRQLISKHIDVEDESIIQLVAACFVNIRNNNAESLYEEQQPPRLPPPPRPTSLHKNTPQPRQTLERSTSRRVPSTVLTTGTMQDWSNVLRVSGNQTQLLRVFSDAFRTSMRGAPGAQLQTVFDDLGAVFAGKPKKDPSI